MVSERAPETCDPPCMIGWSIGCAHTSSGGGPWPPSRWCGHGATCCLHPRDGALEIAKCDLSGSGSHRQVLRECWSLVCLLVPRPQTRCWCDCVCMGVCMCALFVCGCVWSAPAPHVARFAAHSPSRPTVPRRHFASHAPEVRAPVAESREGYRGCAIRHIVRRPGHGADLDE